MHPCEGGAQLGVLRGGAAELLVRRLRTERGGRKLLERLGQPPPLPLAGGPRPVGRVVGAVVGRAARAARPLRRPPCAPQLLRGDGIGQPVGRGGQRDSAAPSPWALWLTNAGSG